MAKQSADLLPLPAEQVGVLCSDVATRVFDCMCLKISAQSLHALHGRKVYSAPGRWASRLCHGISPRADLEGLSGPSVPLSSAAARDMDSDFIRL